VIEPAWLNWHRPIPAIRYDPTTGQTPVTTATGQPKHAT